MLRTNDGAAATRAEISSDEKAPFFDGIDMLPMATVIMDTAEFRIEGSEFSQILQVNLPPGELLTCEPGSMVLSSDGLFPTVDTGGCGQACKRCCCAGESFFRLHFQNKTSVNQFVCVTPVGPGKIIPIDLAVYSGITVSRGAFLAAFGKDWTVTLSAVKNAGVACCGGQGIFKNKYNGTRMAFITAIGTVEVVKLAPGQKIIVEQESVLAFEKTVDFDIRSLGCSCVCCCGGMGMFQAALTGPGTVWVNTLPMSKLRAAIGARGGGNNNNQSDGS